MPTNMPDLTPSYAAFVNSVEKLPAEDIKNLLPALSEITNLVIASHSEELVAAIAQSIRDSDYPQISPTCRMALKAVADFMTIQATIYGVPKMCRYITLHPDPTLCGLTGTIQTPTHFSPGPEGAQGPLTLGRIEVERTDDGGSWGESFHIGLIRANTFEGDK